MECRAAETDDGPAVFLTYECEHHEEGYPGKLFFKVAYTLTETGLRLSFSGTADSPTVVNVTNHAYFNLGGHDAGDILDHTLELNASRYLECDASMIPTGGYWIRRIPRWIFPGPLRSGRGSMTRSWVAVADTTIIFCWMESPAN